MEIAVLNGSKRFTKADWAFHVEAINTQMVRDLAPAYGLEPWPIVLATGIGRRIGSFDANNGIFFESNGTDIRVVIRTKTSGVVVDNGVARANWDDPMDGTGPSGVNINFAKTQIFAIDFQWLGVGDVRFGFNINGVLYYCHTIHHSNLDTLVYMSTPNLPIRYEISNDGTGGAATLLQICSTMFSEGGTPFPGSERTATRGATPLTTLNNTSLYPVVAIRLAAGREGVQAIISHLSALSSTNANIEVQLLVNPTVTGTALSFAALTNSAVEAALGATNATTVSGGTLLASEVVAAGGDINFNEPSDFALGVNIAGVADVLVLAMRKLTGTTEDLFGSITWQESA